MAQDNALSLRKYGFDSRTDDMKQKRFCVSNDSNKFEIIDPKIVAEANKRINDAMKPIIRDFKIKQAQSLFNARKILVL